MNTSNAIAFFILGTVMQVVPRIASLAGGAGYGAAETQVLWLQFMGLVTGSIGAGYLLRMGAREASVAWSRFAQRRLEAREQLAQGEASQEVPLGGVRVTF